MTVCVFFLTYPAQLYFNPLDINPIYNNNSS